MHRRALAPPIVALTLAIAGTCAPGCQPTTGGAATPSAQQPARRTPGASTDEAKALGEPDRIILPQGGKDVLEMARDLNSDRYAKPPAEFRTGHVSPRQLSAKAIRKTDQGFEVQLPSRAPVTTPTVYNGKVFVSGGFHSKEFYALKAEKGELVWALNLDDDGPSTSACEDGVCVFNTESCTIFAVEAETGKLLWSWWLGDPLMSAPTIAHGRVFTSYPTSGRIQAQALQQHAVPHGSLLQPAQAAPQVPAGPGSAGSAPKPGAAKTAPPGASHALAAFDLKTGKILWQKWIDGDVMSAPVAYGRGLYASSFAGTLYVFDQTDGTIVAARAAQATSAPVVSRDAVFFTQRKDQGGEVRESIAYCKAGPGGGGGGYSKAAPYLDQSVQTSTKHKMQSVQLDAANGFSAGAPPASKAGLAAALIGQGNVSSLQAFQGSRILSLGGLNINSMGDEVVATDRKGKKKWSYRLDGDLKRSGGFLAAPPIAAGGQVLVGTLKGEVQAVDPTSGKKLAAYPVGSPIRSQPVVHNGWIYVGTNDGKLVAIDTGNRKITGWTTWGKNAARQGSM